MHILNSIFIEHRKTRKTRMGKLKLAVIMATYHVYYTYLNYQLSTTLNFKLSTLNYQLLLFLLSPGLPYEPLELLIG